MTVSSEDRHREIVSMTVLSEDRHRQNASMTVFFTHRHRRTTMQKSRKDPSPQESAREVGHGFVASEREPSAAEHLEMVLFPFLSSDNAAALEFGHNLASCCKERRARSRFGSRLKLAFMLMMSGRHLQYATRSAVL